MAEITLIQELSTPMQKSDSDTELKIYDIKNITALVTSGKTLETGVGVKSPTNPFTLAGTNKVAVNGINYTISDLYSLPDGKNDNMNIITGEKIKYVGKTIFDGNTTLSDGALVGGGVYTQFAVNLTDLKPSSGANVYCTHFASSATPANNSCGGWTTGTYIFCRILNVTANITADDNTTALRLAKIKTWLTNNPVTVLYELASPTSITVTAQQIAVKSLLTNITNNTGANMSVTYTTLFQQIAKTNRAFEVYTTKELMRAYTVEFTVAYNDPIAVYLNENSVFNIDGQKYDLQGFGEESGKNNATTIQANHVGFRLNNYKVPIGYSYVGTVAQIAQDILNVSGASAEFVIGTCANISGSFSLGNTQEVTARAALFALKTLGVEVDFDNFTLNFPVRCGSGNTLVLETGKNLIDIKRTYQKGNGNTYDVEFANTYRADGSNPFDVGDNCIAINRIRNQTIQKRIITYKKCLDNPTKDEITLGVFVKDSADLSLGMQMDISAAQETADNAQTAAENSLQPGTSYNNVSIDHEHGFMSVSADGLSRTFDNGTDGYIRQQYYNGTWVTVYEANKGADGAGMVTVYNLAHTQKVVMGGSVGYAVYKWDSTTSAWILTGGMDASGTNIATKLTTVGTSNTYGVIGTDPHTGNEGLTMYDAKGEFIRLSPWGESGDTSNGLALTALNEFLLFCMFNGQWTEPFAAKKDYTMMGFGNAEALVYNDSIQFMVNGSFVAGVESDGLRGSYANGDIYIPAGDGHAAKNIHVKYGVITGWS